MDQTILVNAQVHKRPKRGHVADRAFQHHVNVQVFDVFDAVLQFGDFEIGAWVAAGFFQLAQNVFDRDHTDAVVGKQLGFQGFEHVGAAHQLGHGFAGLRHDVFDHGISFGVHPRHVQRVVTASNA